MFFSHQLRTACLFTAALLTSACATTTSQQTDSSTQWHGDENILLHARISGDSNRINPRTAQQRISTTFRNELEKSGFRLYDWPEIALDDFGGKPIIGGGRDSLEIARAIRNPAIDVVIYYAYTYQARETRDSRQLSSQVQGQIRNVNDGKVIASFDWHGDDRHLPEPCDTQCEGNIVLDQARQLAAKLRSQLSDSLAAINTPGNSRDTNATGNRATVAGQDKDW
jgi:hypothetical protein